MILPDEAMPVPNIPSEGVHAEKDAFREVADVNSGAAFDEFTHIASSSPKSQRIKHKLFHGLLAPIRGYTSASQAQFYPRGLFRHSGNVLAFGDRTRINHGVEH
jgi:hypothetical protein